MKRLEFQSTRPSRGATAASLVHTGRRGISIHAPLTGRDPPLGRAATTTSNFNPRAPHGARQVCSQGNPAIGRFQSTRPSRGATAKVHKLCYTLLRKKEGFNYFCDNDAFQSTFLPVDKGKSLKSRCEPPRKFLRTSPSHYKIIGSSGRYVCLQPKCSILLSYFFPR